MRLTASAPAEAILREVRALARTIVRNRRVVGLFVLMVLLPASIVSAVIVRGIRGERVRLDYEQGQRQRHIVQLAEADLNSWLFSTRPDAAASKALLRFRTEGDRIAFPDFQLALPSAGVSPTRPFAAPPAAIPATSASIVEQYYPRIQAFIRDFSAGRNAGAQHFLRLRVIVVRAPGRDDGYVVDVQHVLDHLNGRLAEYSATERFTAAARISNPDERPAAGGFGFEGFPFLHVVFTAAPQAGPAGIPGNASTYAMLALGLVTVLGTLFLHRAVSNEMRLSRLRSDFVAAVSHEFRSPLSSILALSERLESARVRDQDTLTEYHGIIGRDARRLSTLVTRLLDFAQIEEGRRSYAFEREDMAAIARDAIHACQHAAAPDRIALYGTDGSPLPVRGDRAALQHAIQNLIENAAKYSPAGSPITVTCGRTDGMAYVSVRDEGIGIPRGEHARIFEKFYRGRQTSELNIQGVGIGLALVKHVAGQHGGAVGVDSEPGRGSTFTLRLPAAES